MEIDFISFFEKFIYGNIYIYNLINYFSKHRLFNICDFLINMVLDKLHIYLHPTLGVGTNNINILFHYYLRDNSKPYVVYMNAGSHFTN